MTRIKTVRERTSVPTQLAGIVAAVVPPLGLVAAVWLLWDRGVRPVDVVLLAGFYVACGLGITVGFHGLFTHTSFETSAPLRALCTQWVTDHHKHHALSDRPGGESWHNGHHAFPASAVHGLEPGKLDISALVIRGMAKLRLASEVKRPDSQQIPRRRAHRMSA